MPWAYAHLKSHQTAVTISGAGVGLGDGPPSRRAQVRRRLRPPTYRPDPATPAAAGSLAPWGRQRAGRPGASGLLLDPGARPGDDHDPRQRRSDQLATGTSTSVLTVDPKDLQLGMEPRSAASCDQLGDLDGIECGALA